MSDWFGNKRGKEVRTDCGGKERERERERNTCPCAIYEVGVAQWVWYLGKKLSV